MIVLGLVIALIAAGVFENPVYVAVLLTLGNAALLAAGWAVILRTRFQNAGRAVTLLACLVMPLNLWFYNYNQIITLDDHLWVAALFCCIIYTASAYVLKDALFVYVLVAGVTLTGLLILAQVKHFGEVYAPSAMLVFLALICLHAERAFPDIDSPFFAQALRHGVLLVVVAPPGVRLAPAARRPARRLDASADLPAPRLR